jgi:hypothetical protein
MIYRKQTPIWKRYTQIFYRKETNCFLDFSIFQELIRNFNDGKQEKFVETLRKFSFFEGKEVRINAETNLASEKTF